MIFQRKWVITASSTCLLLMSFLIISQNFQKEQIPQIAIVTFNRSTVNLLLEEAFRRRGWADGQNIRIINNTAAGDFDNLSGLIREIADAEVDLMISIGVEPVNALWSVTEEIPVLCISSDPVAEGLVDSLYDLGNKNITGVALFSPTALQLKNLVEIKPDVKRIYAPYHPDIAFERFNRAKLIETANTLEIEIVSDVTRSDEEVREKLQNFPEDIDAIVLASNRVSFMNSDDENYIPFAMERKLPLVVNNNYSVEKGALMTYTYDMTRVLDRIALLTERIIEGEDAGHILFETPDYYLTVNLKTAREIGLEIPESVLSRADNIIR